MPPPIPSFLPLLWWASVLPFTTLPSPDTMRKPPIHIHVHVDRTLMFFHFLCLFLPRATNLWPSTRLFLDSWSRPSPVHLNLVLPPVYEVEFRCPSNACPSWNFRM
jgi:hypothetical protein